MLSERKRMACLENQGIDYNNSRYECDSSLRNTDNGSALINSCISASAKTITLEASNEGVRYTPVRASRVDKKAISIKREAICTSCMTYQLVAGKSEIYKWSTH